MRDDLDSGDSGIDPSFDDVGFEVGVPDTTFDVDSVIDDGGNDFEQFEIPAETEEPLEICELPEDTATEEFEEVAGLHIELPAVDAKEILEDYNALSNSSNETVSTEIDESILLELDETVDIPYDFETPEISDNVGQTDENIIPTEPSSWNEDETIYLNDAETAELEQQASSGSTEPIISENTQNDWAETLFEVEQEDASLEYEETDTVIPEVTQEGKIDTLIDVPDGVGTHEAFESLSDTETSETPVSDSTLSDIKHEVDPNQLETEGVDIALDDQSVEQTDASNGIEEQIAVKETVAEEEKPVFQETDAEIEPESDSVAVNQLLETSDNILEIAADSAEEVEENTDKIDKPVNQIFETPEISNNNTDISENVDFDVVFGGLDNYDFDGINYLSDSEGLDSKLSSFMGNYWEGLSLDDKKSAMEDLKGYVQEVVGLKVPPEMVYYNVPDYKDYGAYNRENNTLEINTYALERHYETPQEEDVAKEAADTVAHEVWHAYQTQCGKNPRSGAAGRIDYQRQYGLDHYVEPQLNEKGQCINYEAYRDQLVEAEAKAFAEQFKGRLTEIRRKS